MISPEYNSSKQGKRWVSYFDRLGFGNYSKGNNLLNIFTETYYFLETAQAATSFSSTHLEFVWFSDTIIFYSTDDSKQSFRVVADVSRTFFDELINSQIPVRGAMAFGDFYGDKANNLFFGKALVDAYEYGEKFDWLGFVLHTTTLKRMNEIGQPLSDLYYKKWETEFRNRETNVMEKESAIAYLVGPGSIMPVAGGNPYLEALNAMADSTDGEKHRRKYANTIQFLKHFSSQDTPIL